MTKQELMDEILARIPVLQNIQGCRDEINSANAQLEALGAEEPIIRFLKLGIGCIGGIAGLAVSALVINVIELLFPTGWFGLILTFILIIYGYKKVHSKVGEFFNKADNEKREKLQKHIENYEQELQRLIEQHGEWILEVLPENYAYFYCAEKIYGYLKNGRADSLKEALNLNESELNQMQVQQLQQQVEQLQTEVAYATQKAADAEATIDSARFWGHRL